MVKRARETEKVLYCIGSTDQSLQREVNPTNGTHVLLNPPQILLLLPTVPYGWVYGSVRPGTPLTPPEITFMRAPCMLLSEEQLHSSHYICWREGVEKEEEEGWLNRHLALKDKKPTKNKVSQHEFTQSKKHFSLVSGSITGMSWRRSRENTCHSLAKQELNNIKSFPVMDH